MYIIKKIEEFSKEIETILKLLSQLTITNNITLSEFSDFLLNKPINHIIYICKDSKKNKIVGIITIFIERKLIHNMGKVGHIEDLVVDKDERNKGISKLLINKCIEYANQNNCYKIILNCNKDLVDFYKKNNFYESGYQMRMNL